MPPAFKVLASPTHTQKKCQGSIPSPLRFSTIIIIIIIMFRCSEAPAAPTPLHYGEFHSDGWAAGLSSRHNANSPPPLFLTSENAIWTARMEFHTCCSSNIWQSSMTNMIGAAQVTGLPLRANSLGHNNHCSCVPEEFFLTPPGFTFSFPPLSLN